MMLIFADRGIQSGWSADSIQSTLEGIEEKFEKCNDKLASVSVGPCSYQFQADKIERMTQDLQLLQSYASSAPDYVWETLDNPLYVDFKNNATESLSQIILDDFYTDNTIGMEEHFTVSQKGAVYSQKRVKETLTFSDFFGLPAVEHEDSMVTLENVETVNEFASLFRKDYDKMKEADIETCIRNYLTSGEFNHEAYHPARDFLSGLLDITIVKPVIEFFTGTDLITGERLTEAQKYQKMAGAIVDMFTFGQGLVAMKGAGLVGKELCKAFGKTMLVEVASSASAYTVGYGVEAMGLPPQIAWMLGAATGCIVSTAGMNLVFRNPKTGVVRECSLEEITSLEKLDASEIDIAKLGKEVPADDLELYMRYQKEGSIEHFTDSEKKTISRIETMGIKGDECEEILRARGKEVTRPQIEKPEAVLPPRNESEGKGVDYSSLRDLMSPAEVARYDEHWLDVAEKISNEALDNQIDFIKNGGITKPGGGAYKPAKISAAVDLNTGDIYFGYNGANKFNPSIQEIHPDLQQRINRTMSLAGNSIDNEYASRMSFEKWSVDNCAEIYSVNNALQNQATLDNIFINTKYFKDGKYALPCRNCQVTFEGCLFPKQ